MELTFEPTDNEEFSLIYHHSEATVTKPGNLKILYYFFDTQFKCLTSS